MHPYAPFAGGLILPERAPFSATSPVLLGDGRPVAVLRKHTVGLLQLNFHILDPTERFQLGYGSRGGRGTWEYHIVGPRGGFLMSLRLPGFRGPAGRGTVTLPDGRVLHTESSRRVRQYELLDGQSAVLGELVDGVWNLAVPVLSIVQAAGLTQCLRIAAMARRMAD